jgi:hypothetical protein
MLSYDLSSLKTCIMFTHVTYVDVCGRVLTYGDSHLV